MLAVVAREKGEDFSRIHDAAASTSPTGLGSGLSPSVRDSINFSNSTTIHCVGFRLSRAAASLIALFNEGEQRNVMLAVAFSCSWCGLSIPESYSLKSNGKCKM
jgi:hypothetical protein